MPELQSDELLTVDEISTELRLHPNTIRSLIKAGAIPAFRVGHQWRIRRSSLRAMAAEQEQALVKAIADEAPPLTPDQAASLRAAGLRSSRAS